MARLRFVEGSSGWNFSAVSYNGIASAGFPMRASTIPRLFQAVSQSASKSFHCSLVIAFVHRFRSMFEVGVWLYFFAIRGRSVRRHSGLGSHTMRDQQPHGIDPGDPPDAHLQSHVLDSNPLIDAAVCNGCTVTEASGL